MNGSASLNSKVTFSNPSLPQNTQKLGKLPSTKKPEELALHSFIPTNQLDISPRRKDPETHPINYLSLSPRNAPLVERVLVLPDQLSPRVLEEIRETQSIQENVYAALDLEEIEQLMNQFYHHQIREVLVFHCFENTDRKFDDNTLILEIKASIQSAHSPLIKGVLNPLQHYCNAMINRSPCSLFTRRLNNAINLLINKNNFCFDVPAEYSPLEFLIITFKNYQKQELRTYLSYILFKRAKNCLQDLIELLEKWHNLDNQTIKEDLTTINKLKVFRKEADLNHQFKVEDIHRTFSPLFPNKVLINYLPLDLTIYKGSDYEKISQFFKTLLNQFYFLGYQLDHVQINEIVENFIQRKTLPDHLSNFLGLGSISSAQLRTKFLDECFPALRQTPGMLYRIRKDQTWIFFNVGEKRLSCNLPFSIIIYPELGPHIIDESRPLAEVFFNWSCFPIEIENRPTHVDFLELKQFLFFPNPSPSANKFNATEKEHKLILKALHCPIKFKRLTISNRLKDISFAFRERREATGNLSARRAQSHDTLQPAAIDYSNFIH